MWSRRVFGQWCASAVVGAGLTAARAQKQPRVTPGPKLAGTLLVAISSRAELNYLPISVAERLGYFAQEGLDVQLREYPESDAALQAVLTGAAQVFSGPFSSVIALHARGQQYQSFVLQGRAPQLVLGVSLRTMGHFRHLSELRGKRVGVVALGSASHLMARLVMEKAGMNLRDVQYLALPEAAQAVQAFRSGEVDALCYLDPLMTQLEREGNLRVVADSRTLRGSADVFGGPMPAGCLSAPADLVSGEPALIQALTNATVHALKWLQTAGPSDIIKVVPENYFQGDRAIYLAAFNRVREAWAPDGLMPDEGPATAARALARFGDTASLQRVTLSQTFTNDFARRAKQLYRA